MATLAPFPHRYTVRLAGGLLSAPPRAPIAAGPPPQFGGTDDVWSPEELLVASALLCLETTFDAFARRERLEVVEWRGAATGVLDKSAQGPGFTAIQLTVELEVPPGSEAQARAVLEKAERSCIISRALKAPVTLEVSVRSQPRPEPPWSAEAPLDEEHIPLAPDGPGVIELVLERPERAGVAVWVESTRNVQTRLYDLVSLPQENPQLAHWLERRAELRFRAIAVEDAAERAALAGRLQPLGFYEGMPTHA